MKNISLLGPSVVILLTVIGMAVDRDKSVIGYLLSAGIILLMVATLVYGFTGSKK